MPSRLCFFFADFVTCANFSNLCGKCLKAHNRYGHHVSARSCAGSWATFSSKKKFEKKSASCFFKRSFEKNAIFDCFLCLIPYFSEPGPNTGSMVSCNLQAFRRLHFRSNLASKCFSDLVFWAKKWMKKNVEKFFLICSSYFSNLTKDTETILPQDKQQGCKLGFAPTKFPSSRMTRSFFC